MTTKTEPQGVPAPALVGADDPDVETITVSADPVLTGSETQDRISDYNAMVRHLKAQPTVRIKTPEHGAYVQINGWSWTLPGNTRLDVPEQVAELLEEGGYI